MCHTPSLIDINWRDLEVICSSTHHTFSHCDLIGSIAFGGLFPSHVRSWSWGKFTDLFRVVLLNIDKRWLWSTLDRLTSKICWKSNFSRPYSWAQKPRKREQVDRSPKSAVLTLVDKCWLLMSCLWGLCVTFWRVGWPDIEKDFAGCCILLTAVTHTILYLCWTRRIVKSDLY